MPRIPALHNREDVPPEHLPTYDAIVASRGRVVGPFPLVLHSPEVASRTMELGHYLRFMKELPEPVLELAIITTARAMDCLFEWAAHVILARKAGVREEAIAAVRNRTAPAGLTPEEEQVVGYVQALLSRHRTDQAPFDVLLKRFGTKGLVELTALVGYYSMIATTMNAFEMDVPPDADLLPV